MAVAGYDITTGKQRIVCTLHVCRHKQQNKNDKTAIWSFLHRANPQYWMAKVR